MSSCDRNKNSASSEASTALQYVSTSISTLQVVDELDPILGELESILQLSMVCPSNHSVKMPSMEELFMWLPVKSHFIDQMSTSEAYAGGVWPGKTRAFWSCNLEVIFAVAV